jgi:hypothetical protein
MAQKLSEDVSRSISDKDTHAESNGDFTWGHTHRLCNIECYCFPECKKKD